MIDLTAVDCASYFGTAISPVVATFRRFLSCLPTSRRSVFERMDSRGTAISGVTSEFTIPKGRREVVGVLLLTGFILFFVGLGVRNLLNGVAIIASLLWLLLVSVVIVGFCKEDGVKKVLINILGAFSRDEFIKAVPKQNAPADIQIGFRIFGREFFYLIVSATRIGSVDWHAGQASSKVGRDLDDWSVVLWYDHGDPIKSQKQQKWKKADQEVYTVGQSGKRELTAAFGKSLVDFLRQAGAKLVGGKDENSFVRPS